MAFKNLHLRFSTVHFTVTSCTRAAVHAEHKGLTLTDTTAGGERTNARSYIFHWFTFKKCCYQFFFSPSNHTKWCYHYQVTVSVFASDSLPLSTYLSFFSLMLASLFLSHCLQSGSGEKKRGLSARLPLVFALQLHANHGGGKMMVGGKKNQILT